ncbi:MAG: hypothetical protein JWN18_658 [Parcubacteria group bacterium]|nr:hypothetical protein [Parcubacteria group bacterium]
MSIEVHVFIYENKLSDDSTCAHKKISVLAVPRKGDTVIFEDRIEWPIEVSEVVHRWGDEPGIDVMVQGANPKLIEQLWEWGWGD